MQDETLDWDNAYWDEAKGEMVAPPFGSSTENTEAKNVVTDSNGAVLQNGDSVQTTKDLNIKGMPKTLKRGSVVKNIQLNSSQTSIDCKIGKSKVQILTAFLIQK